MGNKALILVVATAIALAGCSSQSAGTEHSGSSSAAPAMTGAASGAQDTAHNDADVAFAQRMIPHHTQAVEMSTILLGKQGIDPRVAQIAGRIKDGQAPEVQEMQGWLKSWGNPAMSAMPSMPAMGSDSDHGSMAGMAGMVAAGDIDKLRTAQGVEAAKLYLTEMIGHHQGAIAMAQDELKNGQYAPATAIAQSIVTSQQQQIDNMQGILGSL